MSSAVARKETHRSVDREAAELRRRWWDEGETTPDLVLDVARFETRTGRIIIAPGEATRPGLLAVADALVKGHPEEATLHRLIREAAWAMPSRDRTVTWRDEDGAWHMDWPGQGLRTVVEGDAPPVEVGVRRWEVAGRPFYERQKVWRVIRRQHGAVPSVYLERDDDPTHTLRPASHEGTWTTYLSYIEDTPYAMHCYSLTVTFRPRDGQVEIFESIDTE